MSLRAQFDTNRDGKVTLQHAVFCPVNTRNWDACTCGLFQGYDQPLRDGGNHTESCPCHCTCDFGLQLVKIVERDSSVK